jgi:hypothetical protein
MSETTPVHAVIKPIRGRRRSAGAQCDLQHWRPAVATAYHRREGAVFPECGGAL